MNPNGKAAEDTGRLSMLDRHGHRKFIIPAEVRGRYASRKLKVQLVLMLLFLLLPWIQIGGAQAILLDIPKRHFVFFGLHLYAHDAPLIFLLVLAFVSGLALVTALWGRVWCGWACPQTVFIERVYRQIEIWVEGNYIERRRMQNMPFTFKKFSKQSLKWVLYVLVSALIAHSFMAYWSGANDLLAMMQRPPSQNWGYFVWVFAITGVLLFNFGWFREQFCLIMCPYGKFQSTLLDSHSITVMYDEKRGEPRKSSNVDKSRQGDCVSCQRCVQVCPTGIDIRNGIQMECIGCTACMDACDDIMAKVKKPAGLIRYKALTDKKINWFRGRVVSYAALLLGSLVALTAILIFHENTRIEILRGKDTPFAVIEKDGRSLVQNHFILRLENLSAERKEISFSETEQQIEMVLPENPVRLTANEKKDLPLIVTVPVESFGVTGQSKVTVVFQDGQKRIQKQVPLLGPFRNAK